MKRLADDADRNGPGFLTTCPVNWWLIRRGTKEKM
jgi:hypothetical protein